MDQYTIQSYFKSLCKTYCIAQEQLKRTKKELLKLKNVRENIENSDICENPYEIIKRALETDESFWSININTILSNIEKVVYEIAYNEQSIIVTSEEEIVALTTFFYINGLTKHRIINIEEKYLKEFPADKEFHTKFFEAYCIEDEKLMNIVYSKYVK